MLCVCVFVFWARRGSSVCSSQVLLHCLLRQTGGLWKPLVSTPQSIGTSIICLHVLEIPSNQQQNWWQSDCMGIGVGCLGLVQGPGKEAQLRLKASSCTVSLPLKPKWDSLKLGQLRWRLNCTVDVPKSWFGLRLARLVRAMATLVKCPGYKQQGKRQLIPVNVETFLSTFSLDSGPHPPGDSLLVPTSSLRSACLAFSPLPQSSEGSLRYVMIQKPTPMVLVNNG